MCAFWRKFTTLLLAAALTIFLQLAAAAAQSEIIVLHTNDIHCGVNDNLGMAGISQLKKDALTRTPNVVLVDAGDAIQGAPLGQLTRGEAMVNIMNAVGYDFCIPGNHEFNYGMQRFSELARKLQCGYYSANFIDLKTGRPVLPPYKIMDFAGVKIAFIGAITPTTLTSSTPLYFQDSQGKYQYSFCGDATGEKLYQQLQRYIDQARGEGADYVFFVGHLGLNGTPVQWNSESVAKNTEGLTAIIDGHSHESYVRVVQDKAGKGVLLTQAGTKLSHMGEIRITPEGRISARLLVSSSGKDAAVTEVISREMAAYEELLRQPVGEALVQLCTYDPQTGKRVVRSGECNLGNFAADAYKAVLGCDVALVNGGGLRNEIKEGTVSYQDILEVFPFDNQCIVLEATGQQLLDCLEVGARRYPVESGAFIHVSGLTYSINGTVPSSVVLDDKGAFVKVAGKYRVGDVLVNGKPLDVRKKYIVGGTVYILQNGGNGMTMFNKAKIVKKETLHETNAVIEYIQNHLNAVIGKQYASVAGEGRIRIK